MKTIMFILGTRPEAIKMVPLIKEFKKHSDFYKVTLCVTAQHREMLDQVLNFFSIEPDYDLNLMKPNQSLFKLTANLIRRMEGVLEDSSPDLIFVQGDTTTAFVGALAGFYRKIKVAHIEAKYSPFPEEMNRVLLQPPKSLDT